MWLNFKMAANNIPKLNIVMIGDSGTGKTSLASVFANGRQSYPEIYITTNGLFAYYFIIVVFTSICNLLCPIPFCFDCMILGPAIN